MLNSGEASDYHVGQHISVITGVLWESSDLKCVLVLLHLCPGACMFGRLASMGMLQ